MIEDIPSSEWGERLGRFSDAHRAWLMTLHCVDGDGGVSRIQLAPLGSVTLEHTNAAPAIRVALENGRAVSAWYPRAVRVESAETGAERALEIDARDGTLVRLAFRTAARPETVDGLASAEVPDGSALRAVRPNRRNADSPGRDSTRGLDFSAHSGGRDSAHCAKRAEGAPQCWLGACSSHPRR